MQNITKSQYAGMCGVTVPAITHAVNTTDLQFAVVGNAIDISHPDALDYMKRQQEKAMQRALKKPQGSPSRKPRVSERKGAAALEKCDLPPLDENLQGYLDKTLGELIDIFGNDIQFIDWLKAAKMVEDIQEKRLKNAATANKLVSKELLKKGVLDPVNEAHLRLLTDAAKTITKRCYDKCKAGVSVEETQKWTQDHISKVIKPLKAKIRRGLKNAES